MFYLHNINVLFLLKKDNIKLNVTKSIKHQQKKKKKRYAHLFLTKERENFY